MSAAGGAYASVAAVAGVRLEPRWKYGSLFARAVQRTLAYRGSTALALVSKLIWVAALYYLWRSVYAGRGELGGYDWAAMRTYLVVSFAVNSLLAWHTEGYVFAAIASGAIAVEITRPVSHLGAQLAQALGSVVVEGMLAPLVALVAGFALLGIGAPASPGAALLFLLSVALGFLIKFLISYLTSLLCFWTLKTYGLRLMRGAITDIFSGALMPVALYPGWLKTVSLVLPFQGIVRTPLGIYQGTLLGADLALALAVQVGWVLALFALARLMWGPALRKLTVQGG